MEQLKAVKEQTDLEVNLLQDSLNNICIATASKKMLVPLTASLYVTGTLDDADNVLVDVGTSYFIEKTMVEGWMSLFDEYGAPSIAGDIA
ncbi:hypothetical protein UlMin_026952 [Ulmus minor]